MPVYPGALGVHNFEFRDTGREWSSAGMRTSDAGRRKESPQPANGFGASRAGISPRVRKLEEEAIAWLL